MRSLERAAFATLASLGGAFMSCSTAARHGAPGVAAAPVAASDLPKTTDANPRNYQGLHNVVAYHEGFYSGSAPDDASGFDTLESMGIRTIIRVDGAAPDVEEAEVRGMRYIHLPIGYNGFDEERRVELTRATRDAMKDGPVYIHCHHGKHRSAGAAASIAASMGWMTPHEGVERMKVSGTAPNYKGLYACALESTVLSVVEIDSIPADFPEVSRPAGLVKSMVEVEEYFDLLKQVEKAGWKVPADHPDLVPVAIAGQIADLYRLIESDERVRNKPAEFVTMLRRAGGEAQTLEDMLAAKDQDAAKLSEHFRLLNASCNSCHAKYRDLR